MHKKDDFVMQKESPLEFLEKNVSRLERANIKLAVDAGYELAYKTLNKDESWLLQLRGSELLPRLKSHAVEYSLVQFIKRGLISFNYELKNTSKNRSTFLLFSNSEGSIEYIVNQTANGEKPSREAKYRTERYQQFESYFDFDKGELIVDAPVYTEINHGHQSTLPKFVVLGIPKSNKEWHSRINLSDEVSLLDYEHSEIKTKENELSDFDFDDFKKFVIKGDVK